VFTLYDLGVLASDTAERHLPPWRAEVGAHMPLEAENTHFTHDVMGRYLCNTLIEAQISADPSPRPDADPPRGPRPDARPFDVIVVGGGSFGAAVAQHLFDRDSAKPEPQRHRILVLEAGLFASAEHVQNLPLLGLNPPGPTRIADLRAIGQDKKARAEVWGLAWHSATPFPGLAYCIGGRSIFFGGWSPRLLDAEMPLSTDPQHPFPWPAAMVQDLTGRYFDDAAEQIGTDTTNDFISGPMHLALRQQLFDGIDGHLVPAAVPFAELPLHLTLPPGTTTEEQALSKLEAPLAVQSVARPGFFPFNKFSSVPLMTKAVRAAQNESKNDDVKKRLMLIAGCHVTRLVTENGRVRRVDTSQGPINVPPNGVVVVAAATIESARLALLSFPEVPNYGLIGTNLIAHLRSNLTIRIPRTALANLDPSVAELQASALFVKGRHDHTDGSRGHFHLQITAAGLTNLDASTDSETELFKKVPDVDTLQRFESITDNHVIITIRGIGEMHPENPDNTVRLDPENDEFTVPRAFVSVGNPNDATERANNPRTDKDGILWEVIDRTSDDVAKVFANGMDFEVLGADDKTWTTILATEDASTRLPQVLPYTYKNSGGRRDGLGTTHHEAGTLWAGDDPTRSVTNANGHFHHVENAFAIGPALFPSVGSPNPMLTGIALARRMADRLAGPLAPFTPSDGFTPLFDGIGLTNWRMAGGGKFIVVDDVLESVPGAELGLLWSTIPTPANFILRLDWMSTRADDNAGVFVRFPDPDSKGYINTHYVAVDFGFEVQIDDRGFNPDTGLFNDALHQTGALYTFAPSSPLASRPIGQWNSYEISVDGQQYDVRLNGVPVTTFSFTPGSDALHPDRGLPGTSAVPRFVGLQSHTGRVLFRNVRIKSI
jgi:choline dehydrogenase-like flavoprotein